MTNFARFAVLPAALAATVLLASCGSSGDEEYNDADVTFAQGMIPHHEQAIDMSVLAGDRAGSDVQDLAEQIEDAQGPEIEQLTAMLDNWNEEPMEGEHDGHDMTGMLDDNQMADLENAEGEGFDTLFLEMMIEHHEGAVTMAEEQLDNGVNAAASDMATEIVDTQEAEIEEMHELLGNSAGDAADTDEAADSDAGDHGGH